MYSDLCFWLFLFSPGFAFVYMEDERDAEDAIRALDRFEFGRKGRRLRVEWTKVGYLPQDLFLSRLSYEV
jgi:RNA recognition motif-containing protein